MKNNNVTLFDYLSPQNKIEAAAKQKMQGYSDNIIKIYNKNELIAEIQKFQITERNKILSFIGHGAVDDAGNMLGFTNGCRSENIISWKELADLFRNKELNEILILNFTAVCNSYPLGDIYLAEPFCHTLYGSYQEVSDTANAFNVFAYPNFMNTLDKNNKQMYFTVDQNLK